MKKFLLLPLLGAFALFGTSCYYDHPTVHTKRGAVIGGVLGAGAGALIGEHNDRELEGAAIGGAIGALTGGLLGSARDEAYYGRPPYPATAPRPVVHSYRPAPVYRSFSFNYGHGYSRHYHHHHGYRRGHSRYCR